VWWLNISQEMIAKLDAQIEAMMVPCVGRGIDGETAGQTDPGPL
jgi:hypothetical protein